MPTPEAPAAPCPSWREMWTAFGRIGVLSFGGPAAQIAVMHRELVDRRGWLTEPRFADALAFCMLLPGPEAMQLATYCGWRMRGTAGGLLAGLLFVVPGALVIFALAAVYVAHGDVPLVAAAFLGVKAAVVAIIAQAVAKIAARAIKGAASRMIAAAAFAAMLLGAPFPLIVLGAALAGALRRPGAARTAEPPARPSTLRTVALWGAIWAAPLLALWAAGADRLWQIGAFFSMLAVVTFGGAYAVLAWMAQAAVETQGWLTPAQMADALGLAETTPGPLILVTQFVGILAALPGGQGAAFLGGLVALHATFAPCFLWIFAGAPWIDVLTARPRIAGALAGVSAAVVGVIAHLGLWFATHLLFARQAVLPFGSARIEVPVPASVDPAALALAALSAALLLWRHWPLPVVLAAAAGAGVALSLAGAPSA